MMTTFNGIMTAILLVLFIGIWLWAWSSRNKQAFDELSKLPLEDNASVNTGAAGEKNND